MVRARRWSGGNPGPIQAIGVAQPRVGEVQAQVQWVVPGRTDVVDGGGDLAVGLFPQRPAVLPLDPDRVRALLGKGHISDEGDPRGAGEGGSQVGAVATQDRPFVPGALADELLGRLFGIGADQAVRQGDAVGEGLDALALAVAEEALEVDARPTSGLDLREVAGEQRGVFAAAVEDRRVEFGRIGLHAR